MSGFTHIMAKKSMAYLTFNYNPIVEKTKGKQFVDHMVMYMYKTSHNLIFVKKKIKVEFWSQCHYTVDSKH